MEKKYLAKNVLSCYYAIMKLKDYLEKYKIQQKIFAQKIGITSRYINAICQGKYIPSRKIADKIMQETDGKVTNIETLGLN